MMAIEIKFLSNIVSFLRGTKDMGKSLDDVADSLDDVARDAQRAGDKTEDALEGAETASDRLERSFKDVRDAAKDVEKASDGIGDGGKRGFAKATAATDEFKDEALANISEVASSFDGSMESIGDVVQGTLGGVSANLGALGLAAVPIAASVGLITEAFVKAGEATDEARQSAYEYGLTVASAGEFADAASRINDLTGSVEGLKKVQDIATISGWEQRDVLKALATGDGLPALTRAFNDGASATTIATNRAVELQGVLDGTAQGFDLAAAGADLNARALYDLATQAGQATGATDDLGNSILKMPDGKEVVVDAKTKQAHENLDAFEADAASLTNPTVTVNFDDADARRKYETFRATVTQRLGIPVSVTAPPGIAKWD